MTSPEIRVRLSKLPSENCITLNVGVWALRSLNTRAEKRPKRAVLKMRGFLRVDPGNGEDSETLVNRPPDEARLLLQVEKVILVNPRRNQQQRNIAHRFRRRL